MKQRAGKTFRVTRRADIDRMFHEGRTAADGLMTLFVLAGGHDRSRLCVAISRRHGGAVQRNRIKRLCREAFRLVRADLPGPLDYLIVPRAGRPQTLAGLQGSVRSLAGRIAQGKGREARRT